MSLPNAREPHHPILQWLEFAHHRVPLALLDLDTLFYMSGNAAAPNLRVTSSIIFTSTSCWPHLFGQIVSDN